MMFIKKNGYRIRTDCITHYEPCFANMPIMNDMGQIRAYEHNTPIIKINGHIFLRFDNIEDRDRYIELIDNIMNCETIDNENIEEFEE